MALLVFAILNVMCCYFCYFVGTQKGYNGPLCAFAGLFGSFLACLILLLCCFANKLRKIFIQSAKKKRRLKGF